MKAIFVESANGYLAKGPEDDMTWTPSLDKKLFKLMTFVLGGVCVCSLHTYTLLPKQVLNDGERRFIIAEKTGLNSLVMLNKRFPNAVLVGGPRFLKAAYDLGVIDTFIVTTTETTIKNNPKYENPFENLLLCTDVQCCIKFSNMTIRIYKNDKYR